MHHKEKMVLFDRVFTREYRQVITIAQFQIPNITEKIFEDTYDTVAETV